MSRRLFMGQRATCCRLGILGLAAVLFLAVQAPAAWPQAVEPPSLSIDDVSLLEGDAGAVEATFTVSLSAASGEAITVAFATAGGSAAEGADYLGQAGSLAFDPGETAKTILVPVLGDATYEADETAAVLLADPVGATLADPEGTLTILNDDPAPFLSVDDVSVGEGDAGSTEAVFTVSLSAPSGLPVSFDFATTAGLATGGVDYLDQVGAGAIAAGDLARTIAVPVVGDTTDEDDETFFLNLTNVVGAVAADPQGMAVILDDDPLPVLSVADVSVAEGNRGTVGATFTLSLSAPSGRTVSVDFATADGAAIAGSDYLAVAGSSSFPPGETLRTVTVAVLPDNTIEPDESFSLVLANAAHAEVPDPQAEALVRNDDYCTRVLGFSVTNDVYLSGAARGSYLETVAPGGSGAWELQAAGGQDIAEWMVGGTGWTKRVKFASCGVAPTRVLWMLATSVPEPDPQVTAEIAAGVAAIHQLLPSVVRIDLTPIPGGPCPDVYAATIHPQMAQAAAAAAGLEGDDVFPGPVVTVPDCTMFRDSRGHLVRATGGRFMADAWAAFYWG